jgi:hypothetical protein
MMVSGQKAGCDLDHLERFLRTKSSADLHVAEAYSSDNGKKAFFVVDDKLEAISLLKMNGIRYFNDKLNIKSVKVYLSTALVLVSMCVGVCGCFL